MRKSSVSDEDATRKWVLWILGLTELNPSEDMATQREQLTGPMHITDSEHHQQMTKTKGPAALAHRVASTTIYRSDACNISLRKSVSCWKLLHV